MNSDKWQTHKRDATMLDRNMPEVAGMSTTDFEEFTITNTYIHISLRQPFRPKSRSSIHRQHHLRKINFHENKGACRAVGSRWDGLINVLLTRSELRKSAHMRAKSNRT